MPLLCGAAVKHAGGEQTFDKTALGPAVLNVSNTHLWAFNRDESVNTKPRHDLEYIPYAT